MEVVKRGLLSILLLMVASWLLAACSQTGIYTKGYFHPGRYRSTITAAPSTTAKKNANYYVVKKGDTLYSIAWQHGYDHRQLAYWNGIRPPYTIFPLQRIRVTPLPVAASRASPSSKKARKTYHPRVRPEPRHQPKNKSGDKLAWYWPTRGKLLSTFSRHDAGRKGVDIGGRFGQPVRAAAAGKVVYSGNGLRGYGNLIIVKHNEEFFSAYAHNKKNLVSENQKVKARQQIADMGNSGTDKVQLHFEIRRKGKPVNPLNYLPKHRN